MRFKWYSLDKESHSRELKVKQQRTKGCETRSNSLADTINVAIVTELLLQPLGVEYQQYLTL